MKTYREMIYMIFDEAKIVSDDSVWEVDHIVFMLNKYRSMLFKQRFIDKKRNIPNQFYQRLNIDLDANYYGEYMFKSKKRIPDAISNGDIFLYTFLHPNKIQSYDINFIHPRRFKNVGFNKYLINQVYATIDLDNYLYVKYSNRSIAASEIVDELSENQITDESEVQLSSESEKYTFYYFDCILDNPIDAIAFNNSSADYMDMEFPSDETTNQTIIDLCLKELVAINHQPSDKINNASDDIVVQQQKD